MTQEQINIKLMELGGWSHREAEPPTAGGVFKTTGWHKAGGITTSTLNYYGDLNQLHILEAILDDDIAIRVKWLNILNMIAGRRAKKNNAGFAIVSDYTVLRSTAPERCEALLRAFKLWEEEVTSVQ